MSSLSYAAASVQCFNILALVRSTGVALHQVIHSFFGVHSVPDGAHIQQIPVGKDTILEMALLIMAL